MLTNGQTDKLLYTSWFLLTGLKSLTLYIDETHMNSFVSLPYEIVIKAMQILDYL